MFHLVKDTKPLIENNLLWVKSVRDSIFSMWFNICILVLIVGSFAYFLYSGYGKEVPLKKIEFEPQLWNNAVKNVPSLDYGQIPQTQAGHGVQGRSYRTGAAAI
jgi:hypothetical protein